MDYTALLQSLTQYLGIGAAGAVIVFGIGVLVDNAEGAALAAFKGHDENGAPEKFDPDKLGSFLDSQLGTKKAKVVAAAVAAAAGAALMAQILAGASEQTMLQAVEAVALATATGGASAQFAAVASDVVEKFRALIAK